MLLAVNNQLYLVFSKSLRCFPSSTVDDIHFLLILKIPYQIGQKLHDMISVKLKMIFHLGLVLFLVTMKKLHSWFLDELLFLIYVYVVYFQNYLSRRIEDLAKIISDYLRVKMKKSLLLMHRIFFRNEFLFDHYVK